MATLEGEAGSLFRWIESWYLSQCDGKWEHSHGIQIASLDNPGWSVAIDLKDTRLRHAPMETVNKNVSDSDWVRCEVVDGKFLGRGDPLKLSYVLKVFQGWVEGAPN